jgi:hypothetical protein
MCNHELKLEYKTVLGAYYVHRPSKLSPCLVNSIPAYVHMYVVNHHFQGLTSM